MDGADASIDSTGVRPQPDVPAVVGRLLDAAHRLPMDRLTDIEELAREAVGAQRVRIHVADYAQKAFSPLRNDRESVPIDGTIEGQVFRTGVLHVGHDVVIAPMVEGIERFGVCEFRFDEVPPDASALIDAVTRALMLLVVSKRRYTDLTLQARRQRPLTASAEMQWDLLPPLSCEATGATIAGILEPAYLIGGDSFDYAVNGDQLEFIVVDAAGHGMAAVLKSIAAITTYRNVRREGGGLADTYDAIGRVMIEQFGHSFFVTAVIGSLGTTTGELTWINAGHPLPLLIHDGAAKGELRCVPSMPMGLGGSVREQQRITLDPGDRVLVITDGIIERGADPAASLDRLSQVLVRCTRERLTTPETLRRLTQSVVEASDDDLYDDATMVLVDYLGPEPGA